MKPLAIVALSAMCAVAGPASAHARQSASPRDTSESSLTAQDGTTFEVTRGVVRVPESRQVGGSRTIDLAVVRVRRSGAAPGISHVILAGGPGDSGVDQVLDLARQGGAIIADLMQGDLIGIDQRGTGASSPSLATPALYPLPLDRPGSIENWLPLIEGVSRAEAARFRTSGVALDAYNSRESADDVADVSAALGLTRLVLWGRSYGTHLALATVARHPSLAQRLVLVSPEGPNHTWKRPSQVDTVIARLESRGAGPIAAPVRAILDGLRRQPVRVTVPHPQTMVPTTVVLGAFDVQWILSQALGDPRALQALPAGLAAMQAGDFRSIAQIAIVRRERTGVQSAMKLMMDLSSGASAARRAQIDREAGSSLLGNAINFPNQYLGDAWGAVDLGEAFRAPVRSDVPTLLLVGDLDPRTPVENAREVAATLSRSSVVVVENATHQFDLFGSPVMRSVLGRFLRDEPIPERTISLPSLVFR